MPCPEADGPPSCDLARSEIGEVDKNLWRAGPGWVRQSVPVPGCGYNAIHKETVEDHQTAVHPNMMLPVARRPAQKSFSKAEFSSFTAMEVDLTPAQPGMAAEPVPQSSLATEPAPQSAAEPAPQSAAEIAPQSAAYTGEGHPCPRKK